MLVEIPVFDGHQCFQQIRRHLIDLDQDAVFKVFRVQATDQQGLQAYNRQL
ncbi:hypothetical protein D3C75_1064220 [compost metagenome]